MSSRAGLDHGINLRNMGGGSECQHCIKEDFNGCAPTSGAWMVTPWRIPLHPTPTAAEALNSDLGWCLNCAILRKWECHLPKCQLWSSEGVQAGEGCSGRAELSPGSCVHHLPRPSLQPALPSVGFTQGSGAGKSNPNQTVLLASSLAEP